jgi:hypothetical protein
VIVDILEQRGLREIADREHRLEDRLEAHVDAPALGLLDLEKLVIGGLLDLDEVGHLGHLDHVAEEFPETLATGKRESHRAVPCLLKGQKDPTSPVDAGPPGR